MTNEEILDKVYKKVLAFGQWCNTCEAQACQYVAGESEEVARVVVESYGYDLVIHPMDDDFHTFEQSYNPPGKVSIHVWLKDGKVVQVYWDKV